MQATGAQEKALMVYERAESILKTNSKPGQNEFQLYECQEKIQAVMTLLRNEMTCITGEKDAVTSMARSDGEVIVKGGGTPVIVITDIGRDIDDALALIILSSLRKMFVINPLAVITTLEPTKDRACLARTILDSLSMHDVPVGIGANVNCSDGVILHCYDNVVRQSESQFESACNLMSRILKDAEPKSVKLVCLANLKDASELIVKHETLFRTKIKEVVMMGGAVFSASRNQLIPDDTDFNHSGEAAQHVYAECQQNHIPTTTISRYAAYGCPLTISFLDGLQTTHHLLAREIRNANLIALEELWKKVNMPTWMPGRGKLPVRCNREWFLEFFNVIVGDATCTSSEILKNSALYIHGECLSTSKDCQYCFF